MRGTIIRNKRLIFICPLFLCISWAVQWLCQYWAAKELLGLAPNFLKILTALTKPFHPFPFDIHKQNGIVCLLFQVMSLVLAEHFLFQTRQAKTCIPLLHKWLNQSSTYIWQTKTKMPNFSVSWRPIPHFSGQRHNLGSELNDQVFLVTYNSLQSWGLSITLNYKFPALLGFFQIQVITALCSYINSVYTRWKVSEVQKLYHNLKALKWQIEDVEGWCGKPFHQKAIRSVNILNPLSSPVLERGWLSRIQHLTVI